MSDPQLSTIAATTAANVSRLTAGISVLSSAAASADGASPETLVDLLEELQRNKQLQQLVEAGLLNWSDLLSDKEVTLPDGSRGRIVDHMKLLRLQQRLSTLAQKQAGKLENIKEVAVRKRTVPGPKAAAPNAIYPNASVFVYPRELPAGRPGQ